MNIFRVKSRRIEQSLEDIKELISKGKYPLAYEKAIELYNSIMPSKMIMNKKNNNLKPQILSCLQLLSTLSYSMSKYNECLKWSKEYFTLLNAIDKYSDNIRILIMTWSVWLNTSLALCCLEEPQKALEAINKALNYKPRLTILRKSINEENVYRINNLLNKFKIMRFILVTMLAIKDLHHIKCKLCSSIHKLTPEFINIFKEVMWNPQKLSEVFSKYEELGYPMELAYNDLINMREWVEVREIIERQNLT